MANEHIGERLPVLNAVDAYLDHHGRNKTAVKHVVDILTKYDHMVSLARDRALEELDCDQGAQIIPFPASYAQLTGQA